jgi:hypothetical protein
MTGNLGSVKLSQLDHDSLDLRPVASLSCFKVGRSSSTGGKSSLMTARSSVAIICKLGFSQPAISVCKSWGISSFAEGRGYLRLFRLITGSMSMHFTIQRLHSCIPRSLAVVKAVDQTPPVQNAFELLCDEKCNSIQMSLA